MSWAPLLLMLGFVGVGVFTGVSLIRSGRQGWGWAVLAAIVALVGGLLWFASKTGGGDKDNYDGGSGGGGGATGSW